jgi:hypothetical protein
MVFLDACHTAAGLEAAGGGLRRLDTVMRQAPGPNPFVGRRPSTPSNGYGRVSTDSPREGSTYARPRGTRVRRRGVGGEDDA